MHQEFEAGAGFANTPKHELNNDKFHFTPQPEYYKALIFSIYRYELKIPLFVAFKE